MGTDEAKDRLRLKAAKWRDENREKVRETNRKCYAKNAERINKEKRERLKTDLNYRQKIIEREKKYRESGRRHEVNSKPDQLEKARQRSFERRNNKEKKLQDIQRKATWRKQNKKLLHDLDKRKRVNLEPSYVAHSMRISVSDLSPEIYETKKLIINLKRELKANNVKIK
jgi:hypothetical protein